MRKALASCIAVATGLLLASALPAGATTSVASPLRYVALGDSYSAASGNVPPDPSVDPACLRSLINYPHLIAKKAHASLHDATCGGAKTSDYFSAQYPDVPRQLDTLRENTQLVTMTIGGNDSNVFIDSIAECGAEGISTGGTGSPCKDKYGDSFDNTIKTTTYPALVAALQAVHAKSPHARVAILSYPWILPKTVGCFPTMPVATGDVPYLRDEQVTLNDAVQRAAKATHSIFVNLNQVSNGHDACKRVGVRWIEPVVAGSNPVIVHPNPLGERKMALQTETVLGL